MANLVLTNLDTGQSLTLADTSTLAQAMASVELICNQYTDNSSSQVLITAKTYADKAMLLAIDSILPTIPTEDYPSNSGALRIVVGKTKDANDVETLQFFDIRNEQFILAGDLLSLQNSKTFTLSQIAQAKLDLLDQITKSSASTFSKSKSYTKQEIARIEGLINQLDLSGFTFDTFLEYLDRVDPNLYVSHLNSTIDIDGKIQRLHYKNEANVEFELHNIFNITSQVSTSSNVTFKDIKHNGFALKYVAKDNTEDSYFGLFAIRSNIIDSDPYLYIDYKTGSMRFAKEIVCEENIGSKNSLYDKNGFSSVATTFDLVSYADEQINILKTWAQDTFQRKTV